MARGTHAMDGADAYYGVRLSDRIIKTDVGIICVGAVIARTGTQDYRFADLPQEEATELGLKGNPDDIVTVHRDERDVFDPEFMASLEGKPVTDGHPPKLLTGDTVQDHRAGHMQGIRRGTQKMKSGDIPLLADLHITCKALIAKIKAGLRQLSCGYTYHIALDGRRILQVDMTGNHVAVLKSGRAGPGARIYDAALTKEKPVKLNFRHIFGLGLQALSADETVTPEQLAEAATAMDGLPVERTAPRRRLELQPEPRRRAIALDQEGTYTEAEVLELVRRDRASRADTLDRESGRRRRGTSAQDAEEDARKRAHTMLDKMLDSKDQEAADEDQDLTDFKAELMELLADSDDDDEAMDSRERDEDEAMDEEDDEDDDEEKERKRKARAEAEDGELEESELIPVGDRAKDAIARDGKGKFGKDRKGAGMDGADVLKLLRATVARSSDKRVRAAFDRTLREVRKSGRGEDRQDRGPRGIRREGTGYGAFAGAAGGRAAQDGDAGAPDNQGTKSLAQLQTEAYAKYHRKNPGEVTAATSTK